MLDTTTDALSRHQTLFVGGSGHRADPAAIVGTAPSGPHCSQGATPGSAQAIPWYVIRHRPFVGKAIADRVRELGFEARHFREERRRAKRDDWFEPVFPGYVFVQIEPSDDAWKRAFTSLKERGVLGILGTAGCRALAVPEVRMAELLAEFDERGEKRLPLVSRTPRRPRIVVGASVQIVEGPWIDCIGVCQFSAADRIKVLLSVFGRETPVEIPVSQVREVA